MRRVTRSASIRSCFIAAVLFAGIAACTAFEKPPCGSGQHSGVHEIFYFGTGKPGGIVTPEDWSGFAAGEITPRFPAGFSVFTATGQWRNAEGFIVKESTYVLDLVHDDTAELDSAARELVAVYEERFHQEAVLRVENRSCFSF